MWKKIEGNTIQTTRSILKKQKSQVRASFDNASQNSITLEKSSDRRAVIHQVNFQFDFNPNKSAKEKETRQIHSRQGTKRIGGKVIMPNAKERKGQKKENIHKQNSRQRFSKDFQNQSIVQHNSSEIVLLQIKSCFADKQKQTLQNSSCKKVSRHKRHVSNADTSSSKDIHTDKEINQKIRSCAQTKTTEQIFQAINRKMAEEKELYHVKRNNKNCFFLNLKKKLQKQMTRIEKQSDRNQCKFLLQGCEIQKHRRNLYSKSSLTQRIRPKTALQSNRTNISSCRSSSSRQKRPMSCQSRSPHPSDLKLLKEQSKKALGLSQQKNRQRNTVKQKECQNKYISSNIITLDYSNSLKKMKSQTRQSNKHIKGKSDRRYQNEKLNQILAQCNNLEQFSDLNKKMRTFQYYCQKMDVGMQKAEQKLIDLHQANQLDDD